MRYEKKRMTFWVTLFQFYPEIPIGIAMWMILFFFLLYLLMIIFWVLVLEPLMRRNTYTPGVISVVET